MKKLLLINAFFYCINLVFAQNTDDAIKYKRDVTLKLSYKVQVQGHIDSMQLTMLIPASIKQRQTINKTSFSIEPDSIFSYKSNTYARFSLHNIDKDFKVVAKYDITIYKFISEKEDHSQADSFAQYLIPEKFIESNSEDIIKTATSLKQKTDIETVMKTYFFVKDNITYQLKPSIGAEQVLKTGEGKCTDFSDLFVALLRANNIPAKTIGGITVDYDLSPYHQWAEAYLVKQGWVLFDPTTGQTNITRDGGSGYKMQQENKYIIMSEMRSDPVLNYNWLFSCRYKRNYDNHLAIKISCDVN
jgi:transglutaminase-like putative cysteine protease